MTGIRVYYICGVNARWWDWVKVESAGCCKQQFCGWSAATLCVSVLDLTDCVPSPVGK